MILPPILTRLKWHFTFAYIRFQMRRKGRPSYSDASMALGIVANERAKWTHETYEEAALAEIPKMRATGFVGKRDLDRVERSLREKMVSSAPAAPAQEESESP